MKHGHLQIPKLPITIMSLKMLLGNPVLATIITKHQGIVGK
jgi:hypothetical protein